MDLCFQRVRVLHDGRIKKSRRCRKLEAHILNHKLKGFHTGSGTRFWNLRLRLCWNTSSIFWTHPKPSINWVFKDLSPWGMFSLRPSCPVNGEFWESDLKDFFQRHSFHVCSWQTSPKRQFGFFVFLQVSLMLNAYFQKQNTDSLIYCNICSYM